MGLLEKHLTKEVRYKEEDLIVYEPKRQQLDVIKEILENTLTINSEMHVKGTVDISILKYLIKNLTNIGDEIDSYNDEEIISIIDNDSDRVLKNVINELMKIVKEVVADIQLEQATMLDTMASVIESVETKIKLDKVQNKYEKIINQGNKKTKRKSK